MFGTVVDLRRLKKHYLPHNVFTNSYHCTTDSILSGCITVWFGSCTATNCNVLQSVVKAAEQITDGKLRNLEDI